MSAKHDNERRMAALTKHRTMIRLKSELFDQQMAAYRAHMDAIAHEAHLFYEEYTAANADGTHLTPETYSADLHDAIAKTTATYTTYLDARREYEQVTAAEGSDSAVEPIDGWDEFHRRGEVRRIDATANQLFLRFGRDDDTDQHEAEIRNAIEVLDRRAGPALTVGKALYFPDGAGGEAIYLVEYVNDDRVLCQKILIGSLYRPNVFDADGWMPRAIAEAMMNRHVDHNDMDD